MKRKTKLAIITSWLITFLIGAISVYLVYGQTASTFWISEGAYPSASAFSVFRDGSTYFAKNAYGRVMYEDTNATWVINSAINSTEDLGGGCVQLSAQTFEIDSPPIRVGHNVELKGYRDSTVIYLTNGATTGKHQPIIKAKYFYPKDGDLGDETWNITLRDFTIDGNKAGNIGFDDSGGAVMGFTPNLLVENLVIRNCIGWAGIYTAPWHAPYYNTTTTIRNNIITGTTTFGGNPTYGSGIYVTATRNGTVLVENNNCANNYYAGIHNEDLSNNTIIRGNKCSGNGGGGIISANSHHVVITSNICFNNLRGIVGSISHNSIISDNICEFNTYHGIWMTDKSNNSIISSNIVKNNGQIGQGGFSTGLGITDSNDCIVSNNMVYDDQVSWTQWTGIETSGTTDYTIITSNNCRENGGLGIIVNGANDKVNLCWNMSNWIA